jgi:DNA-binding NtrC family response regulator
MYLKPLHMPKARILVLEEDRALRASLRGLLSGAGYAPAESANGTVGRIDLVLASLDGRQTPKAALDLLDRSAPVILLVDYKAWAGFDFFDVANDLGAVAVLQRPFPRAALLRLVARVLSEGGRGAAPVEDNHAELPGLAELLLQLENPNFA